MIGKTMFDDDMLDGLEIYTEEMAEERIAELDKWAKRHPIQDAILRYRCRGSWDEFNARLERRHKRERRRAEWRKKWLGR